MPSRQIIRAKLQSTVEQFFKFNLLVTKHIWIWRASACIFLQEILKHFVHVFFLEVYAVIRNANLFANSRYIFKILSCRAVSKLICVVPILHEDADDIVTLFLKK